MFLSACFYGEFIWIHQNSLQKYSIKKIKFTLIHVNFYPFQFEIEITLENTNSRKFTWICVISLEIVKFLHGVDILLRRKCILGSFLDVPSQDNWNRCLRPVTLCSGLRIFFHRTILPSLDLEQYCKSEKMSSFSSCFQGFHPSLSSLFS